MRPAVMPDGKDVKMKLKVRYEDKCQEIVISDEDLGQLMVCLGINADDVPEEEREQIVQEAFDVQFNRPDYNNWHKHDRHWGNPKTKGDPGEKDYNNGLGINDGCDPFAALEKQWADEELKDLIRKSLVPSQAEAVIAVYLDRISVSEFAAEQGVSTGAISHRLEAAYKNLKKVLKKN